MTRATLLGALVLACTCALGWLVDARAMLGAYLAAWWLLTGALLGGLALVWLHELTGGAWGDAVRAPLLRAARLLPLACLLFLPVLAGLHRLYPWADGLARWHGEFSAPAFKGMWLAPGFFIVRSLACLLAWSMLSWLTVWRAGRRSAGAAAASLLACTFTVGIASVDWIMSLEPAWYSSVFGWLALSGQLLAGLALALLLADRAALRPVLPDLGNLLLMCVMVWAYLSYVQFLIIWAANLPHEIGWYVRRRGQPWIALAWLLVLFHGAGPVLILLSRRAKRSLPLMQGLAATLLLAHLLDCWWLVLPSLDGLSWHVAWLAPLVAAGFGLPAWSLLRRPRSMEAAHA